MLHVRFPRSWNSCRWCQIIFTLGIAQLCASGAYADEASDIASAKSLSRAFRAVSKRIAPSVVRLKTTIRTPTLPADPALFGKSALPDSPPENLFRDRAPGAKASDSRARHGFGSGVIIDAAGLVLTNYHVVDGADEITVELADGTHLRAAGVKADEASDLAVVWIKAGRPLHAATLGDSDKLQIGDWVLAIGYAFDLDMTVSAGIIGGKACAASALAASDCGAELLQTNAMIGARASGGPLVDLDGKVVGIVAPCVASSAGCQGAGFAIPANLARWVARQLVEKGSVQRAYLGVRVEEIRGPRAEQPGIDPGEGVQVAEIFPDTPAAKAGLRNKDRILKFAGRVVHSPRQLQEVVEQAEPGTPLSVQIVREGKSQTVEVVASPAPRSAGLASTIMQEPNVVANAIVDGLGMKIAELAKADINRFHYEGLSGALVQEVDPRGAAARAGIRGGMLVVQIDKTAVHSVAQFHRAMTDQSLSKGLMLLVRTPEGGNRLISLRKP